MPALIGTARSGRLRRRMAQFHLTVVAACEAPQNIDSPTLMATASASLSCWPFGSLRVSAGHRHFTRANMR